MAKADLTAERLRELLHYDQETGVFTRRVNTGPTGRAGNVVGSLHSKGYLVIGLCGFHYRAHRLAWLYVYGSWPDDQIDHINLDKADNRICNLRQANNSENLENRGVQKNNKSGFIGVCFAKRENKWLATITKNKVKYKLGFFDTAEEAGAKYLEAKKEIHKFNPFVRNM